MLIQQDLSATMMHWLGGRSALGFSAAFLLAAAQ